MKIFDDCVCNHHNYYGWCECANCNCIEEIYNKLYEKYIQEDDDNENHFSGSDEEYISYHHTNELEYNLFEFSEEES